MLEDAGKNNLFELDFDKADDARTLGYFAAAGKLLADIHRRNIYHGDTKTPNFVVNDNCADLPPVVIVDCDRIRQYDELPDAKKACNLAQFIESARARRPVESVVSHFASFCRAYKESMELDDAAWKKLLLLTIDIAENKRHIERLTSKEALQGLKKAVGAE